jgi:signal transduction histidine kinase
MRPNLASILPVSKSGALDHERLTSLINSMADGVIALDEKQRVVLYNGAALNILDVNSTMAGRQLSGLFSLVDKNSQVIDLQKLVLDAKTPMSFRDYLIQYPDKSTINLYLSIAPVHLGYAKRGSRGYVLLLRDITREKSLEEERDEFISVVSHELRTPIAISEGNVSNALLIAQKSNSNKQIVDALNQAHDQIIFLSDMINDLSTLSRAERGKLTVELEAINVHELVDSLFNTYKPQAESKGLQLLLDLDPRLELLQSSRLYVREVLQNFVTNAIKYTETGSVTLGARMKDNGVEFFVQDTGIGISKGDQEKVFDKFFRSEDFRTRKNNGTGLGLYVTMKLSRLIHAEIDLQSELNKGSVFTIFTPNLK